MKPNRPTLVLVAAGILAGFVSGILIQKMFPVGRTIQKIKEIAGIVEDPNIDAAFVPVSPPPEAEILALAKRTTIVPKSNAEERLRQELRGILELQLPAEEAFRQSDSVTGILSELRSARNKKEVAEIEYRFDRVFRESNLRSLEEAGNREENLKAAADRIAEFSDLLAEKGTHLIYSPAPNPLDCYLSRFAGISKYRSARPNHSRFLMELLDRRVDVVDLRREFGEMALAGREPYHRFDHHWTPAGIELAAEILRREIASRFEVTAPFGDAGTPGVSYRWIPIRASGWNLNLAPQKTDPGTLFGREVMLGDAPMLSVPRSPIWVMGDSMLLEASQTRSGISADFGSHLSGRLKAPVNTLGRPGTVDIRPAFFLNSTLAGTQPKLLIWIHSDEDVHFPEIQPGAITAARETVSGTVRILEASPLPDPQSTPYPDAIFSFRADLLLPREQTKTVIVYAWGFRKRTLTPLAGINPGDERTVTLQPWLKAIQADKSLGKARVIDQLDNSAGDPVFWLAPDR